MGREVSTGGRRLWAWEAVVFGASRVESALALGFAISICCWLSLGEMGRQWLWTLGL